MSTPISDEAKGIVFQAREELEKEKRPLSATTVLTRAEEIKGKEGRYSHVTLPKKRKVGMLLKEYKHGDQERTDEQRALDMPWSLATCVKDDFFPNDMPAEAVWAVLDAWKTCIAVGRTFSIRDARWVARLYKVVPQSKAYDAHHPRIAAKMKQVGNLPPIAEEMATYHILYWAQAYSQREKKSEILKEEFDTSDLDAVLAMTYPEWAAFQATGLVRAVKTGGSLIMWRALTMPYTAAQEVIHRVGRRIDGTDVGEDLFQYTQGLTVEQDRIYAVLLNYMARGPKWGSLSDEQCLSIFEKVRGLAKQLSVGGKLAKRVMPKGYNKISLEELFYPADTVKELMEAVGHRLIAWELWTTPFSPGFQEWSPREQDRAVLENSVGEPDN